MTATITCKKCNIERPIDRFIKPTWKCKNCMSDEVREKRHQKRAEYLSANPKPIRTSKPCKVCGIDKPLSDFRFANKAKQILSSYCKPCQGKISNAHRLVVGRVGDKCSRLKTTVVWYYAQLATQDYKCAVCRTEEIQPVKKGGKPRALAIDHDHETGKVRGLLCFRCNTSIHMLEKHGFEWATKAIEYLKKHQET